MRKCPCSENIFYAACCKPYHEGKNPENALILMRSRYAAYALCVVDYIAKTSHLSIIAAEGKDFFSNVQAFCKTTSFLGLFIHSFVENEQEACVTFSAKLTQNTQDASFQEKSLFVVEEGIWRYKEGKILRAGF